ncbi:hypothetical protein K7X08_025767 [Anisodus acutangulus]|uniref:Uncharacterized protein n=1 Tax=Anisodus acutangulus TaxID=402998 RepID=A0A9Q1LAY8_9SOLA|nr:hypothetical protein K7X08_025767 [Anisodus acutangulus]
MCGHCGRGPSVIVNRLTSIKDELAAINKLLETKPRRHSKCVSSLVSDFFYGSHLSHPDYVDDVHDGPSISFPDEVVDAVCKTLPLTKSARVHNDDDPSSHFPDQVEDVSCKTLPSSHLHVQVDDASCKTLPGEVADSAVDSEDRSSDERITDVLAQIHDGDDIEEFEILLKMDMRLPMKKLFVFGTIV